MPVIDAHEIETEPSIETLEDWRAWLMAEAGGIAVAAGRLLGVAGSGDASAPRRGVGRGTGRPLEPRRLARAAAACCRSICWRGAGISVHEAIADPGSPAVEAVLRRLGGRGRGVFGARDCRGVSRAPMSRRRFPPCWRGAIYGEDRTFRPGPRGLADRLAVTWSEVRPGMASR